MAGSTGQDRTCIYTSETWETTVLVSRLEGILVVVLPRHIVFSRLKSKPNYKNHFQTITCMLPLTRAAFRYYFVTTTSTLRPRPPSIVIVKPCLSIILDGVTGGAKGDLYLVTKWGRLKSRMWNRVFQIPASAWPDEFDGSTTPMYSPKASWHVP